MPAIVGTVSINSISNASVFHVGDLGNINPISTAKTYSGAGSFNTGDYLQTHNGYSMTYTYEADVNDQNIVGNA